MRLILSLLICPRMIWEIWVVRISFPFLLIRAINCPSWSSPQILVIDHSDSPPSLPPPALATQGVASLSSSPDSSVRPVSLFRRPLSSGFTRSRSAGSLTGSPIRDSSSFVGTSASFALTSSRGIGNHVSRTSVSTEALGQSLLHSIEQLRVPPRLTTSPHARPQSLEVKNDTDFESLSYQKTEFRLTGLRELRLSGISGKGKCSLGREGCNAAAAYLAATRSLQTLSLQNWFVGYRSFFLFFSVMLIFFSLVSFRFFFAAVYRMVSLRCLADCSQMNLLFTWISQWTRSILHTWHPSLVLCLTCLVCVNLFSRTIPLRLLEWLSWLMYFGLPLVLFSSLSSLLDGSVFLCFSVPCDSPSSTCGPIALVALGRLCWQKQCAIASLGANLIWWSIVLYWLSFRFFLSVLVGNFLLFSVLCFPFASFLLLIYLPSLFDPLCLALPSPYCFFLFFAHAYAFFLGWQSVPVWSASSSSR